MISKKTKYALSALVYLGKKEGQGPVLISEIAENENIPPKFLETILLEMKNSGIVNSKKGKGGGYYLRAKPEEISIAQILRHFDGAIALLPCVSFKYYERCAECHDEETCSIREAFQKVRDASVSILKGHTIKDLIDREAKMIEQKINSAE